jgi:hypothetical protein
MAAAGALVVALFLLGCGGGDSSTTSGSFGPNVVTESDIDAQEDGSPARSLLEWWQAYQFGDASQVLARTSQDTIDTVGEHDLTELVKNTGQGLQGVEVLGADETANDASVRVGLLQFTPEQPGEPPPDEPTSSTPDTFAMQKQGGEWLFNDPEFLIPKIESFQQAQQQQTSTTKETKTTSTGG